VVEKVMSIEVPLGDQLKSINGNELYALGWDIRLMMEFDQTAIRLEETQCGVGYHTKGVNFYTTKEHRETMPGGYLFTRCPDHFLEYLAKKAQEVTSAV
jgi:hypothetical protein